MTEVVSDMQRQLIGDSFRRQGFLRGMGARMVELASGRCLIELPFGGAVSQQHNFFHGGAIGAVADAAGGYAAMSLMPDGTEVVTVEYKINFLRPAIGATLTAEGHVLRAGRSITVTQVDVYVSTGEERTQCAVMQQTVARTLGVERDTKAIRFTDEGG